MHYFTAGYVDVWSNDTGTSPVHSFRGPGSVNQVELSESGDQLLAVNNNIIRVEHSTDGQWTQQRMFELPTKVSATVPNVLFSQGDKYGYGSIRHYGSFTLPDTETKTRAPYPHKNSVQNQ